MVSLGEHAWAQEGKPSLQRDRKPLNLPLQSPTVTIRSRFTQGTHTGLTGGRSLFPDEG
jgi:hypothetical protein